MKILSKEQILMLHEQLIDATGGLHGVRDEGLLDSALAAPFNSKKEIVLFFNFQLLPMDRLFIFCVV